VACRGSSEPENDWHQKNNLLPGKASDGGGGWLERLGYKKGEKLKKKAVPQPNDFSQSGRNEKCNYVENLGDDSENVQMVYWTRGNPDEVAARGRVPIKKKAKWMGSKENRQMRLKKGSKRNLQKTEVCEPNINAILS